MPIIDDQTPEADEVMNALGSQFLDFSQLLFNADYIGFSAKLHNTGVPNLDNVFYSTFTSDDADTMLGFEYDSTNDLYFTPDLSGVTEYVIIEATSLSAVWDANDCKSLEISAGKWLVYCDTGSDAVHRAQIHKSLWYGTDGTDALMDDFTSVTAVKVSHANDVGMQAHMIDTESNDVLGGGTYTGTFVNTTTNNNCSSWSRVGGAGATGGGFSRWEMPSASVLNTETAGGTSDELGTDLTGDEQNNPATCQIDASTGASTSSFGDVVILCFGDITWVNTTIQTIVNVDYFTDNSIPLFTAADSLATEGVGPGTLIFKDTVASTTNAIASINSTIDATSSEQISISANGGSNFTDVNNGEIARPTSGTALWRKIVITRTDVSKLDKVTEQAVKHSWY